MAGKKHKLSDQEIAGYVITSKEAAEVFIKRWMEQHGESRERAIERLRQLGIELSKLRDKR